mgnify:CR=1 FL=1
MGRAIFHAVWKVFFPPAASMTCVGAPAPGQRAHRLLDVGFGGIDEVVGKAALLREVQAEGIDVDQDGPPRPEQPHALGGAEAHRPRAEDGDRVAEADIRELRAEIAGREDIAQEERVLIRDGIWNFTSPRSAKGTRTYSAWPPSMRQPSSQPPFSQLLM